MRIVSLSEVISELESGARPKGGVSAESGTIPSIGAEHLANDGGFNFHKNKYISESFFTSLKTGKIAKHDVLIVKDGATTGKVSFVSGEFPFKKAAVNEHVFRISIKPKISEPRYVYYFLKSPAGKKQLLLDFRGATVGGISRQFAELTRIPLPPLDVQIRIATVLTRAEQLIAKRKDSIKAQDELLKSTFLEMFGDPVRNEKGWEKSSLSEILSAIESGQSPVCLDRPVASGEWGVLKLGAVTKCVYDPKENKAIPESVKPNPKYEIRTGDVLFTRKNTYELVAACAYVWKTPPKLMMPDLIFRLVPRDKTTINPVFLHRLITCSTVRKAIQRLANGAAGSMPNISKGNLMQYEIIIPPIIVQNKFAAIVEKVEELKAKYQQSLVELENLYGSLSQRAFKGELDLSGVRV